MREICIKKYVSCIYVALLFFVLPIQANDYKHSVQGSVVDNMTGIGVTAKITGQS